LTVRFAAFVLLAAAVIVWLSAGGGEYASAGRFFLKELFRQMF
jgi:hypothetical protein